MNKKSQNKRNQNSMRKPNKRHHLIRSRNSINEMDDFIEFLRKSVESGKHSKSIYIVEDFKF